MKINYTEPGTPDSPLEAGGFVLGYPDTQAEALSADYLIDRDFLPYNWGELNIEFLTFNPNTYEQYYSINFVQFKKDKAGIIDNQFWSYAGRDFYANPLDGFRAFLEIIWLATLCHFIYKLIKEW